MEIAEVLRQGREVSGLCSESSRGVLGFRSRTSRRMRAVALLVDLASAVDRLSEPFRRAHPEIDWSGIRAVRKFIAHDYDGTDDEILWQAISAPVPAVAAALLRA